MSAALFGPESRAARARRFDPVGQALVMLVLGSVGYALTGSPATNRRGARWPQTKQVLGRLSLRVGRLSLRAVASWPDTKLPRACNPPCGPAGPFVADARVWSIEVSSRHP